MFAGAVVCCTSLLSLFSLLLCVIEERTQRTHQIIQEVDCNNFLFFVDMTTSIADLRLWVNRHTSQLCTATLISPDGATRATFTGTIETDENGHTVLVSNGQALLFPEDNGTSFADVSCAAGNGKGASVFGALTSAIHSRANSPSQSPAPQNPTAAPRQQPQAGNEIAQLAALVTSLARSVSQQQQQVTALTASVSQALSVPRFSVAPGSIASASSGGSDTAAVLSHLRDIEEAKSKIFSSRKIGREYLHLFSPDEITALAQLPVAFELHKEEEFFAEHLLATVALSAFIVTHLQPCFQATRKVGDGVTAFFAQQLKQEKIQLSIERAALLRSACQSLDFAIILQSNPIAQEAFLTLSLLSLLLDKEHALCYPRLSLCTISATPTSASSAPQVLAGKACVRVSKALGGVPTKKGAGVPSF